VSSAAPETVEELQDVIADEWDKSMCFRGERLKSAIKLSDPTYFSFDY
jgi:hypothetical protein